MTRTIYQKRIAGVGTGNLIVKGCRIGTVKVEAEHLAAYPSGTPKFAFVSIKLMLKF